MFAGKLNKNQKKGEIKQSKQYFVFLQTLCIAFIKPGIFAGYERMLYFFRQHFKLKTANKK